MWVFRFVGAGSTRGALNFWKESRNLSHKKLFRPRNTEIFWAGKNQLFRRTAFYCWGEISTGLTALNMSYWTFKFFGRKIFKKTRLSVVAHDTPGRKMPERRNCGAREMTNFEEPQMRSFTSKQLHEKEGLHWLTLGGVTWWVPDCVAATHSAFSISHYVRAPHLSVINDSARTGRSIISGGYLRDKSFAKPSLMRAFLPNGFRYRAGIS